MIKGKYKLFSNGHLLAETSNVITNEGKGAILRYLAGWAGKYAEAIAVGSVSTAASTADAALKFEFARAQITLTGVDYAAQTVTFKGTLDQQVVGKIYEVGLWSSSANLAAGDYSSKLLLSFEPEIEEWNIGSFSSTNARLGAQALLVNASSSSSTTTLLESVAYDLSGYSTADPFVMAYYGRDANTASIRIRLRTDATNYFQYTHSSISAGYNIFSFTKSNVTTTGSPNWANITSVEITVTATSGGATNVDLDGFRIEDSDTGTIDYVLVSRAVLGTPITKTSTAPLDIEYVLDFSIS